ncbi:MAG: RNA-binding domain-containing protein [Thermofilaceae archaeon]
MLVRIRVEVRPTEDIDKVAKAVQNLFEINLREENHGNYKALVGEGGSEALVKFRRLLFEHHILDSARHFMLNGLSDHGFVFYLNKQAAYCGKPNFCTFEASESPLGPIIVEVITDNPKTVILWLAPRTVHGEPIIEIEKIPDP